MLQRKPASASAQQLDDNASKRLAAHRKERELRSGSLLDRLRIGELKTIAEDARATGDIDNRVAAERLFECALPHLLALPTITRRGFKGAGDLGQFAHDFAPRSRAGRSAAVRSAGAFCVGVGCRARVWCYCATRRGARVTAEPVQVTCAACRRSLVWRDTAPAPRVVPVCFRHEGTGTRH